MLVWLTACGACSDGSASEPGAGWSVELLEPRTVLDTRALYPFADELYLHDPAAGLLLQPDREQRWPWEEHERGEVHLRTNNLGLLEETPTAEEKSGLRILVAGDSHLMVVDPAESFPNQLESRLRAAGHAGCEALNAGVGYTSPRSYLARLRHHLHLAPDVFVVSLYSGNDFWEDLIFTHDIKGSPQPRHGPGYRARLEAAKQRFEGPLSQGLNQAHFFKHWPGTAEVALREVLTSLDRTRELCEEEGIRLVTLVLPTKIDVDEDQPEERRGALATLELTEEDAGLNRELARAFAEAMAERGVPCLDLTAEMLASPTPFFWRRDHHLAVAGHALAGERLFELLEPMLR